MIMSSEVSSNLARYDGVRYGLRVVPEDGPVTIERVMSATRPQVSATRSSAASSSAPTHCPQVTTTPTAPHCAYAPSSSATTHEHSKVRCAHPRPRPPPRSARREDRRRPHGNVPGRRRNRTRQPGRRPGALLPGGLSEENQPARRHQFTAPAREDARLYRVGAALEELLTAKWGAPLYKSLPDTETLIRL